MIMSLEAVLALRIWERRVDSEAALYIDVVLADIRG